MADQVSSTMHQCSASGGCERCERRQDIPAGSGRLLLHVPVRHMRARVSDALDACGDPWRVQEDDRNGGRVYAVTTDDVMVLATALLLWVRVPHARAASGRRRTTHISGRAACRSA